VDSLADHSRTPHVQMEDDLHVLNRQIPDRALIATMDPVSRGATHGTKRGKDDPFTDELQTLGLPVDRKQTEAAKMWKRDI
jgi:hypothetical protein